MEKYDDKLGFGLASIGILILLCVSYSVTHLNTWHDEIFSM